MQVCLDWQTGLLVMYNSFTASVWLLPKKRRCNYFAAGLFSTNRT